MKILKWIAYIIVGFIVNCGVNSALFKLFKLDEKEKEALDAELY